MKSKNATFLRSLSTSKLLTGLLTIGLILPNTGCQLGKSKDQPGVSWRDWMPRSLVRARAEADQASTEPSSETTVAANSSSQDDLQDIAPLPPKADSQTLPMAPMPSNDLPELVAIDNDLPELETTPVETSDTGEAGDKEKDAPKNASLAEAPSPDALLLEEAPAEEAPAEEAPAEEAPAEEAPAEEAPAEEAPAEEAPAEEAPAEEAPVEEAPVEEAPVEEAPVEEAPAEEAAAIPLVPAVPIVKPALEPAPIATTSADLESLATKEAPAEQPKEEPAVPDTPTEADLAIARSILENFKELKEAGDLHHFSIYLRVVNGTAELSGELISELHRGLLLRAIRSVEGVKKIKDLLVVKSEEPEIVPSPQPATPVASEPILERPMPQVPAATPEPTLRLLTKPTVTEIVPIVKAPLELTPAVTPEVPTVSEPGQQEPAAIVEAEATPKVEEKKSKAAEESKPETTEGPVKVRIELPNPVEEDLFKIE